jgi:serine/threonine-protein kinase
VLELLLITEMQKNENDATLIDRLPESSSTGTPTGESESQASLHQGFVVDSLPSIGTETKKLLRLRLQATGLLFSLILISAYVRSLLHFGSDHAIVAKYPSALVLDILVICLSVITFVGLKSRHDLSLQVLRNWELALFSSMTVLIGYLDFLAMSEIRQAKDLELIEVHAHSILVFYLIVAFVYGMLIPNKWQKAIRVILFIVLTPVIVRILFRVFYPEMKDLVDAESVTYFLFVLAAGGGSALYGTYIINSLRVEAFQARQMGQYRLVKKIGVGGMGEVWRAEHKLLARPSAVKLISPEVLGMDSKESANLIIQRFALEARETANLTSPHSIVVYDFGITQHGVFYYVMELLNGMDMSSFVERFGPQPPERVIHLMVQVCKSLSDAHSRGLIHRDIKPGNIFLCKMGPVYDFAKVLDFGLVKVQSRDRAEDPNLTRIGTTTGTPAYMAPEQALGEKIDGRADLYALGCVGYYLLTGLMVFESKNPTAVVIDHVRTLPEPPSSRSAKKIPSDLEAIIMRCLSKSPENRFSSAEELEIALSKCQDFEKWGNVDAKEWWEENIIG